MISVLYADRPSGRDGIRDFSEALAGALNDLPATTAQLVLWDPSSAWPRALDDSSSIVLQYNPFSYGRRGFAPSLLSNLRRQRGSASLCVLVHEPYVPISDARSAAMGSLQRIQLRLLLHMADAVGVSTEGFRCYLPTRDRARTILMPAGSPLPDARDRRAATRDSLGLDAELVLALYGSAHDTRLLEHCAAAITGIAEALGAPTVLNLGFAAPSLPVLPEAVRVVTPGTLPAADLAACLAASDIALLPYLDGASTRRTTMIAALQQQTCVLSTLGALTDEALAAAPSPIITPVRDRAAFVNAAVELATDPELRHRTATLGRTVFEKRFCWPVLARRIESTLAAVQSNRMSVAPALPP